MSQEPIPEPSGPETGQPPEPQGSGDHPSGWGTLSLWMALAVVLSLAVMTLLIGFDLPLWVGNVIGFLALAEIAVGGFCGFVGTTKDKKKTRATLGLVIHGLFVALVIFTLLGPALTPTD